MRTHCHDIQQSLGPLLAGELLEDDAKRVEIHVASCAECARVRARFQRMDALLAAAPVPMPSRDEIALMALRARAESGRAGAARRAFLAAAAVVAMLLIPAATYLTFTPPEPVAVSIDGSGGTYDMDF